MGNPGLRCVFTETHLQGLGASLQASTERTDWFRSVWLRRESCSERRKKLVLKRVQINRMGDFAKVLRSIEMDAKDLAAKIICGENHFLKIAIMG